MTAESDEKSSSTETRIGGLALHIAGAALEHPCPALGCGRLRTPCSSTRVRERTAHHSEPLPAGPCNACLKSPYVEALSAVVPLPQSFPRSHVRS